MTFRKTAGNFVFNIAKKAFKKDSTPEVIDKVSISKNLKKFQKHKDDIIKSTDKYTKSAKTEEDKIKFRKPVGPALGKLSKLTQQFPEKKAKGGRVGRKGGGGLGAQSVKYGLDNNYDVTAADPKAKFIAAAKNKKKKLKKFDSPMAKAVKKKDKKKVIV
jgi:hypothetical protein